VRSDLQSYLPAPPSAGASAEPLSALLQRVRASVAAPYHASVLSLRESRSSYVDKVRASRRTRQAGIKRARRPKDAGAPELKGVQHKLQPLPHSTDVSTISKPVTATANSDMLQDAAARGDYLPLLAGDHDDDNGDDQAANEADDELPSTAASPVKGEDWPAESVIAAKEAELLADPHNVDAWIAYALLFTAQQGTSKGQPPSDGHLTSLLEVLSSGMPSCCVVSRDSLSICHVLVRFDMHIRAGGQSAVRHSVARVFPLLLCSI